ncbi:MAG: response regulator [Verrucomicrobiota bacterium]
MNYLVMKPRILILEDDKTSRKLLVKILEKSGYDVLECSEGKDAIHIAVMNPPKVIVVDVMLPDMSGTNVVEELTSKPECKYMKVIFLTSLLTKKDAESNVNYLFDVDGTHYKALAKPVKKKTLTRLLNSLIAESEAEEKADLLEERMLNEKKLADRAARLETSKAKAEKEAISVQESEEADLV